MAIIRICNYSLKIKKMILLLDNCLINTRITVQMSSKLLYLPAISTQHQESEVITFVCLDFD